MDAAAGKRALRRELSAARRAVGAEIRDAETGALAAAARALPPSAYPGTVCAYHPVGSEPGASRPTALLDALVSRGNRVLLPVVRDDGPLDWGEYTGELRPGPLGLREPAGPRCGPAAISAASLVLVPALAVDRAGVRLGRGGGHYDRSLPLAGDGASLVAVIRDTELVDELPAEPHDVRVTGVLTPGQGLLALPRDAGHLRTAPG